MGRNNIFHSAHNLSKCQVSCKYVLSQYVCMYVLFGSFCENKNRENVEHNPQAKIQKNDHIQLLAIWFFGFFRFFFYIILFWKIFYLYFSFIYLFSVVLYTLFFFMGHFFGRAKTEIGHFCTAFLSPLIRKTVFFVIIVRSYRSFGLMPIGATVHRFETIVSKPYGGPFVD